MLWQQDNEQANVVVRGARVVDATEGIDALSAPCVDPLLTSA